MTHLCHTLEEASEKLNLTETVLVRLSQYFKVPRAAYEESGYLSFKGDLAFSEPDLDFFRQVKERLLMGEKLEEVKRRMREESPASTAKNQTQETRFENHLNPARTAAQSPEPIVAANSASESQLPETLPPMREIQDRQPYEKAAQQSFERYKSVHRTGLVRVFENMLKEVGSSKSKRKPESSPPLRPMRLPRGNAPEPGRTIEQIFPFQADSPEASQNNSAKHSAKNDILSAEPSWEQVIKQAVHQPRTMNSHLKGAAALLRERAMGAASRTQQPHR